LNMNGLGDGLQAARRPATLYWMPENSELLQRIDCLCSRSASGVSDPDLLAEMEDLLAEGYVQALTGEGRSRRLQRTLEGLADRLDSPEATVAAREAATSKRTVDLSVSLLRERLAILRDHFIRVGGGRRG
jgi:hypothetical protein